MKQKNKKIKWNKKCCAFCSTNVRFYVHAGYNNKSKSGNVTGNVLTNCTKCPKRNLNS